MRHGDNHVGGWLYEVAFDFLKRTRFIGHLEIKHTLVRFRSSTFATNRSVSGLRGRNLIEKSVSPVALLSRASGVPGFPYMITSSLQRWQRPLLQASQRLQVCQNILLVYSSTTNKDILSDRHVQKPCIDSPHRLQLRTLLTRPQINNEKLFRKHGVPGLLSKEGFDISWTQYQSYIIEQLNDRVAGTPDAASPPRHLLLKHSRSPSTAAIFNYASMADNNHLFFSTLSPTSTDISTFLRDRIEHSFSSVEALRQTFLATADAMFGPGFTWLVKKNTDDTLAILNTYIAGSPWPAAHYRKQSVDMNNMPAYPEGHPNNKNPSSPPPSRVPPYPQFQSQVPPRGGGGGDWNMGTGAFTLEVMMGVNTWEHVWLRDYGVHGKEQFLARWWDHIDWYAAEKNGAFRGNRGTR